MEAAQHTAQSFYVVYRQLPVDVQVAFLGLLQREEDKGTIDYSNAEWLSLTEPSLRKLWDAPEEDYWDRLYAERHAENRNHTR